MPSNLTSTSRFSCSVTMGPSWPGPPGPTRRRGVPPSRNDSLFHGVHGGGEDLEGDGGGVTEAVHELGLVGDDHEAVGVGIDHLFQSQGPTGALYQVELGVYLVGAIHGDVDPGDVSQVSQRDSALAGEGFGGVGGGDPSVGCALLANAAAQLDDGIVGGGAGTQAHDRTVGDEANGLDGGLLLGLLLWVQDSHFRQRSHFPSAWFLASAWFLVAAGQAFARAQSRLNKYTIAAGTGKVCPPSFDARILQADDRPSGHSLRRTQ